MTTAWTDPTQALGQEMNTDDLLQLSRDRSEALSPTAVIAANSQGFAEGGEVEPGHRPEVRAAEGGEISNLLAELRSRIASAPHDVNSVLTNPDSRVLNFRNYLNEPTLPQVYSELLGADPEAADLDPDDLDELKRSVSDYMGNRAFGLNRALRRGSSSYEDSDELSPEHQTMSDNLNQVLSLWHGLSSPLALYRGINLPAGADYEQMLHDPAFQSWSTNPLVAHSFPYRGGYSTPIVMARMVEPGEVGIALKNTQPKNLHHEMEVLLPPQNYRLTGNPRTLAASKPNKYGSPSKLVTVKPYAGGGEVDDGPDTGLSVLKRLAAPMAGEVLPAEAAVNAIKSHLPDISGHTLSRLADLEHNHPLLKRYTAKVAENFMGLDPQGRLALLRAKMPGFIDQVVSTPGGLAHLAGLSAEALGADPNSSWERYLNGSHLGDPEADDESSIDDQVSKAMGVGPAHGLAEHIADAAGFLSVPLPSELAGGSKLGRAALEYAGSPPNLRRLVTDSTLFGGINDASDLAGKLKSLYDKYGSGSDEVALQSPGDDMGSPGYGEGGEVNQLRRALLKYLGAGALAAHPVAGMIEKAVTTLPEGSSAVETAAIHPKLLDALHRSIFDESDEPDWENAEVLFHHIPDSEGKDLLGSHLENLRDALNSGPFDEVPEHAARVHDAISDLADLHGVPLEGDEDAFEE